MNPTISKEEAKAMVRTTINYLGGFSRLKIMTGAKNFLMDKTGYWVSFRIGRNAKGVNYVKLELNGKDLYDMTFGRVHGNKFTVIEKCEDLFFDMLAETFEEKTGMFLTL